MFEGHFDKFTVGASILGIIFGGSGIVIFAVWFQNKKHGFIK